jgi:replication factor C large subunit
MKLSWDVDDTPETIEQWVEGNVHVITDPGAVKQAYRSLARADEYIGYTYRRQYHTLWRYATAVMLLGVADAAGGTGIHTRILPPERWQKMSTAKKQKAIRYTVLSRLAAAMQIPQTTLREKYLSTIALLVEHDPETFTRELVLDAEGLNFFLNDRARSLEIVKAVTKTEREQELEQKKKGRKTKAATAGGEPDPIAQPETKPPVPIPDVPPDEPATTPAPDPADKKPVANNQSTLFDGF